MQKKVQIIKRGGNIKISTFSYENLVFIKFVLRVVPLCESWWHHQQYIENINEIRHFIFILLLQNRNYWWYVFHFGAPYESKETQFSYVVYEVTTASRAGATKRWR